MNNVRQACPPPSCSPYTLRLLSKRCMNAAPNNFHECEMRVDVVPCDTREKESWFRASMARNETRGSSRPRQRNQVFKQTRREMTSVVFATPSKESLLRNPMATIEQWLGRCNVAVLHCFISDSLDSSVHCCNLAICCTFVRTLLVEVSRAEAKSSSEVHIPCPTPHADLNVRRGLRSQVSPCRLIRRNSSSGMSRGVEDASPVPTAAPADDAGKGGRRGSGACATAERRRGSEESRKRRSDALGPADAGREGLPCTGLTLSPKLWPGTADDGRIVSQVGSAPELLPG